MKQIFFLNSVAFWPTYRFLRGQVRYSQLFKNFPQFVVICRVKGFSVHNEAEVVIFLKFYCLLHDAVNVGNLISASSSSLEPSLYIWKFSVHIMLKPRLNNFEHKLARMWKEHSCMVVWTFFGIALIWDWNENWTFPVLWPLLSFPKLLTYWVQHFHSIIFQDFK